MHHSQTRGREADEEKGQTQNQEDRWNKNWLKTRTRSYKENFGVNLLYAKILALLLVQKSHVTTLLPSDWFKFLEQHYATPKKFYKIGSRSVPVFVTSNTHSLYSSIGSLTGANAMKHLQARFTKFCKTSQFLNSILAAIVVKFTVLKDVIALKCQVLKLTHIRYLNFTTAEAESDFVNLTCITNL